MMFFSPAIININFTLDETLDETEERDIEVSA